MKLTNKILLAISAIALLGFVSCNDKNDDPYGDDYKAPAIKDPKYSEQSASIQFSKPATEGEEEVMVKTQDGCTFNEIKLTDSGVALIEKIPIDNMLKSAVAAKEFIHSTFTMDGGKYVIKDVATVAVNGNTVNLTNCNTKLLTKQSYSVKGSKVSVPTPPSGVSTSIFSSWKVYSINLVLSGGDLSINHLFDGANANSLPAIANYINGKKPNLIDVSAVNGYVIKRITLDKFGTFSVEFTNGENFDGECTVSGTGFAYHLYGEGNFVFNADGEGSIEIDSKTNMLVLAINGTVKQGSTTYTTVVTFKLIQVPDVNK